MHSAVHAVLPSRTVPHAGDFGSRQDRARCALHPTARLAALCFQALRVVHGRPHACRHPARCCKTWAGRKAVQKRAALSRAAAAPAQWGFTGTFDRENGGGFLTDHFPEATKACWEFHGIFAQSRHIPGVRFAGLIHPGARPPAPRPARAFRVASRRRTCARAWQTRCVSVHRAAVENPLQACARCVFTPLRLSVLLHDHQACHGGRKMHNARRGLGLECRATTPTLDLRSPRQA